MNSFTRAIRADRRLQQERERADLQQRQSKRQRLLPVNVLPAAEAAEAALQQRHSMRSWIR